jgi:HSP20 family protein
MTLIKWSPFFQSREDFDPFFDSLPSLQTAKGLVPAVDIYDENDHVVVETALPGVDPKNVEVTVENGVLTVKGTTERKTEVEEKDYYRKEIRSGSFMRQVALPTGVIEASAKAKFQDGMLKIEIPKQEQPKATKISIDVKNEN